jgi:hypothetical protein
MRLAVFVTLVVIATACPKRVSDNVAGSDDAQMDQYTTQLEQVRAQTQATDPTCKDWCSLAKTVCAVSRRACEIAGRNASRQDMQSKCAASQEDCVQLNDRCASCSR